MKETGGRECGESRVEDRGSCRPNEMEGRCESDWGRDEVYPAASGDEERTGLKLDDDDDKCNLMFAVYAPEMMVSYGYVCSFLSSM